MADLISRGELVLNQHIDYWLIGPKFDLFV